jgi:hypothetical protein
VADAPFRSGSPLAVVRMFPASAGNP